MRKPPRVARIRDVARVAGVSVSTVSLVLNGKASVTAETAKRVREAAEQLDYRPHQAARSLASKKADAIGLLLPRATPVSDAFFAAFLNGVLDAVHRFERYLVLLPSAEDDASIADTLVQAASARRIDAVILMEASSNDARLARLVERSVPVALFGRTDLEIPWVDVDNRVGGELAARHLLEVGHRNLAHIAAPRRYTYALERSEGFVDTATKLLGRADRPVVLEAHLTAEAAYRATAELFARENPPTAIFAASDLMASGVLAYAQQHGITVPGDLGIVGFDDTPIARSFVPTITTLSQEPIRIGRQVGTLLLEYLSTGAVKNELLVPTLRVGDSTTQD